MRLLIEQEMSPASLLTLAGGQQGGDLAVRVIWCRQRPQLNYECGVVYRDQLEQLEHSWVKPALRRLGFTFASLHHPPKGPEPKGTLAFQLNAAGQNYPCQLWELGLGGAVVEVARPIYGLQEGAPVKLLVSFEDLKPLGAQIGYSRLLPEGGERYGLCFLPDRITQGQARLLEGYLQALA